MKTAAKKTAGRAADEPLTERTPVEVRAKARDDANPPRTRPLPASLLVARRERVGAVGGTLAALGLAAVGTGESLLGAGAVLGGLVITIAAVHTYGRLGEES